MMGVWFLSISVAQYFAGMIAQVASVETVGGQVTNLKVSLDTYNGVFTLIAEWAIGLGIVLLLLSWPLKKYARREMTQTLTTPAAEPGPLLLSAAIEAGPR